MKLKKIKISGVGGISSLVLDLDPKMNIICGPNGVGKTTILESIAHCFATGASQILKRNAKCETSSIDATFEMGSSQSSVNITIGEFEPNKQAKISGRHDLGRYVMSLKTTRTFAYQPLDQISRDPEKPVHRTFGEAISGISLTDIKNWFVNRYLYSAHAESLRPSQVSNFNLAKRCFSVLNEDFSFKKVDASTNEIIVTSPGGDIYYEYLSSGFKSCLSIIFGIIKEIEFRFGAEDLKAEEFDGVILIDEIDLHLHPEWQSKIPRILLQIFPGAQFVASTHSPHVIQAADPNQILALEHSGQGVSIRYLPDSAHGFKGWTIDEVLTDVMGMRDTRSAEFLSLIAEFGGAIDSENLSVAERIFEELDLSLHPNNAARKLLRIQINALRGVKNDQG